MRELFDDDVQAVVLACATCGAPVELARSALSLFESEEKVLCVECLVNSTVEPTPIAATIEERAALIDRIVEDFGSRLRNVLLRSVRPDLSWNSDYGFEEWSDPADSAVAAHAPGIWYAGKSAAGARRRYS
jgi:hypothetical protein